MTSIWLLPEGRQEQRLQELINRLAEEHATVAFAPHLTVFAGRRWPVAHSGGSGRPRRRMSRENSRQLAVSSLMPAPGYVPRN